MSVKTLRKSWKNLAGRIEDLIFNRAGTESGFLRFIAWLRFAILISLTLRFGTQFDPAATLRSASLDLFVLGAYFAFIIGLRFLSDFRPQWFESTTSKGIQVIIDTLVIAFFYSETNDPRADVFLLYFVPALIIARYFGLRAIVLFIGVTVVLTATTWLSQENPADLAKPVYWISRLLPRLAFLGVLTLFYLIYHRRRRIIGRLDHTQVELVKSFREMTASAFCIDRQLRITALNDAMRRRHGAGLIGKYCYDESFCRSVNRPGQPCSSCPLAALLLRGEEAAPASMRLADRHGVNYDASVSVLPMRDSQDQLVGATAIVLDMARHKLFEQQLESYSADVERTVDYLTEENRGRVENMTRQIATISRASAAMLSPDEPLRVDQIVRAATDILRCQVAEVHQYNVDQKTGQAGLLLYHSIGYVLDEETRLCFLALDQPSVIVDAYNDGKARSIEDVHAEATSLQYTYTRNGRKPRLHAMACFPLQAGSDRLGTLSLYRDRRQLFTPEEMQLGEALAHNLAAVIFNQNLLKHISSEAQLRRKEFDALMSLSQQLAPHDDMQHLAQLVADVIREQLGAEVTSVFLLENNTLFRTAISGVESDWFAEESYQVGEGITGQVISIPDNERYGKPIIVNTVDQDPSVIKEHLLRYSARLKNATARHLLAVPLNGLQGSFGVLRAVNRLDPHGRLDPIGFTQHDLHLMSTMAAMVAVAMENSRRLAEHKFLAAVGQTVTRSLSLEEVLSQSLDLTVKTINAEAGSILLLQKSGALEFSVTTGMRAERLRGKILPAGVGIAGAVAQIGKPELISDVTLEPRHYADIAAEIKFDVRSLLCVPIQTRENIMGVIEVVNKTHGTFIQADLNLLSGLSPWIAIAIENARLFESESKRGQSNAALLETMRALSSSLDLKQILANIFEQLQRIVQYNTASLFLRDGNTLLLKAHSGFPEEEEPALDNARLDATTNVPFREMEASRKPYIIHDNHQETTLDNIVGTGHIRSWIGAPLLVGQRVIGNLAVDHWEPNQYDEDDAAVVMAFAQQAAIAITNADLFNQQRRMTDGLLALNNSLIEITSADTLDKTVDTITQSAARLLQCDIAGIALYDQARKSFYTLPDVGCWGVGDQSDNGFRHGLERLGEKLVELGRDFVTYDGAGSLSAFLDERLTNSIGLKNALATALVVGRRRVGVLCVASRSSRQFSLEEQTIFSNLTSLAAVAIRNVELLAQTERRAELLDLLHQISVTGQRTGDLERILNILLTGVTAEYGLRFNRALLLLMHPSRKYLIGHTGIGQTDKAAAHATWANLGEQSIDGYAREVLEHGVPGWTQVHYLAKNLRIPIKTDSPELFSQAILTQRKMLVDPTAGEWLINPDFFSLFDPAPFALVPLVIDGRVTGILVADNKFTGASITQGDLELLAACASQAAAVIERTELSRALQSRIDALNSLQEVGRYITDFTDPHDVLCRIVDVANTMLGASFSHIVPYNSQGERLLVDLSASAGNGGKFTHTGEFSNIGLTNLVMQEPSGLVAIDDVRAHPNLYSKIAQQENFRSAAIARMEFQNEIVGVLYVNYRHLHHFSDSDMVTLEMVANQAAIVIHNTRLMEQYNKLITESERDRLREDLHDTLNTFQFKVMLPAENIRDRLRKTGNIDAATEVDRLWRVTRHMYQQFHRILQDMSDPALVERGLVAALRAYIDDIPNLAIDLNVQGNERPSAEVELALYRIAQEAINNVIKHALIPKGTMGRASLDLIIGSSQIQLTIQDNGPGFLPGEVEKGESTRLGLYEMKNWATKIGAQFSIQSAPNKGTRIEVCVPHTQEAKK